MIDFVAVNDSFSEAMTEYADHLHDHFVHPIGISRGRYFEPSAPGFGAEVKPESIAARLSKVSSRLITHRIDENRLEVDTARRKAIRSARVTATHLRGLLLEDTTNLLRSHQRPGHECIWRNSAKYSRTRVSTSRSSRSVL